VHEILYSIISAGYKSPERAKFHSTGGADLSVNEVEPWEKKPQEDLALKGRYKTMSVVISPFQLPVRSFFRAKWRYGLGTASILIM